MHTHSPPPLALSAEITKDSLNLAVAPRVRCECRLCGAHAQTRALRGRCGNCGSDDLRPLPEP